MQSSSPSPPQAMPPNLRSQFFVTLWKTSSDPNTGSEFPRRWAHFLLFNSLHSKNSRRSSQTKICPRTPFSSQNGLRQDVGRIRDGTSGRFTGARISSKAASRRRVLRLVASAERPHQKRCCCRKKLNEAIAEAQKRLRIPQGAPVSAPPETGGAWHLNQTKTLHTGHRFLTS